MAEAFRMRGEAVGMLVLLALAMGGCSASPEARSLALRNGEADAKEIARSLADPLPQLRCDGALACARQTDSACMDGVGLMLKDQSGFLRDCALDALATKCDHRSKALILDMLSSSWLGRSAVRATERCPSADALLLVATTNRSSLVSRGVALPVPLSVPTDIDGRISWMRNVQAVGEPAENVRIEIQRLQRIKDEREAARQAEIENDLAMAARLISEGAFDSASVRIRSAAVLGADTEAIEERWLEARRSAAAALVRQHLDAGDYLAAESALEQAEELGVDLPTMREEIHRAKGEVALRAAQACLASGDIWRAKALIDEASGSGVDVTQVLAEWEVARAAASTVSWSNLRSVFPVQIGDPRSVVSERTASLGCRSRNLGDRIEITCPYSLTWGGGSSSEIAIVLLGGLRVSSITVFGEKGAYSPAECRRWVREFHGKRPGKWKGSLTREKGGEYLTLNLRDSDTGINVECLGSELIALQLYDAWTQIPICVEGGWTPCRGPDLSNATPESVLLFSAGNYASAAKAMSLTGAALAEVRRRARLKAEKDLAAALAKSRKLSHRSRASLIEFRDHMMRPENFDEVFYHFMR